MPLDRAPGVRLVCFGHVGAVRLLSPPPLLPLPGREPVRAWQRAAGRGSPPPVRTSVTHLPQFPPCYSPSAGPAASAWRRAALTKLLQGRLVQPPPSPRERGHRAPLGAVTEGAGHGSQPWGRWLRQRGACPRPECCHTCANVRGCASAHTHACAQLRVSARRVSVCKHARTRGSECGERAPMSTHTECACAHAHARECAWDCAWMSVHERECVGMSVCGRTLKSSTAPSSPALGHRVNPGMFAG